jgi:hypothetical protein
VRLPNADRAVVDMRKLTEYVLNPNHPKGGDKAYLFDRVLGINQSNPQVLMDALLKAVMEYDGVIGKKDAFGQRYNIIFPLRTEKGEALVRSGWIIGPNEDAPRLATCFIDD